MNKISTSLLFVMSLLTAFLTTDTHKLRAAEPAIIKVVPPEKDQYWVGQRIDFAIDLLIIGQFSGSAQFDLPKVSGFVVMKSAESPTLLTQEIDEETYVVQRHEFVLFSQNAGTYTFPAFTVRFGSKAAFDKPLVEHRLQTTPVKIEARYPPEAKSGEAILSTTDLKVTVKWEPLPDSAQVGDAFERMVTLQALDVPGMLLPTLPKYEPTGLTVYPRQSQVKNNSDRGTVTGKRIATTSFICSQEGKYDIPGFAFRWWDIKNETWQTESVPSVVLDVSSNPNFAAKPDSDNQSLFTMPPQAEQHFYLVLGLFICVSVFVCFKWGVPAWRARQTRWEQSPNGKFAQVKKACATGDPKAVNKAIGEWLATGELSVKQFTNLASQAGEFHVEYRRLQEALIRRGLPWDGNALLKCLQQVRASLHVSQRGTATGKILPTLNPAPLANE